jgi:hypothetical protein
MAEDWRAPITLYLQGHYHPSDHIEAKRLKHRSIDFAIVNGHLYKLGISQPMLKCITEAKGKELLREVHRGIRGSHSGPRALAAKVIRQGFYWSAIVCTTNRVTHSCEACQKLSPRTSAPSQLIKLIARTCPLQRWGLDIVGPLPTVQGNLKITFVVVEYFTNWIEDRAISIITSKTTQKLFWQNIVCRFRVPSELIVHNENSSTTKTFGNSATLSARRPCSLVYHPQSNRVVERANDKIFSDIKKRLLDVKKGKWAVQLPKVIWALNTTKSRVTKFTPFCLMYGSEAMMSQELKHGSPRASSTPDVDESTSKDLIDEDRVLALEALNKYQAQTKA